MGQGVIRYPMTLDREQTWRIASDGFEAEIMPSLGRVMRFGPIGGPNAFWTNPAGTDVAGWRNFGGEKLWLWPQDRWPELGGGSWPPPLDGRTWTGKSGSDWAEWKIPLGPELPGLIRRRATIQGGILRVLSEIFAPASIEPFRLWSVTQTERPTELEVHSPTARIHPSPGEVFERTAQGWKLAACPPGGGKWFFDSARMVAATPAGLLTIRNHANPSTQSDEPVERAQVFFDADQSDLRPHELPPYAELEWIAAPGSSVLDLTFELAASVVSRIHGSVSSMVRR
jgi:hypothetical protein